MEKGNTVFVKNSLSNTVKNRVGFFVGLGGLNIPLIRIENEVYSVYKEEMVKIPDEIKDWPVEEIKLYVAL